MNSRLASEILALSLEHLQLVSITILVAAAIGLPGAVLLARRASARRWVLGFANIAQTIPSLALFGFLLPIPLIGGIGKQTAIVALCLYALLPILRNALVGILGVDPAVRESAVAMGMTHRQILWQVELPLAMPLINLPVWQKGIPQSMQRAPCVRSFFSSMWWWNSFQSFTRSVGVRSTGSSRKYSMKPVGLPMEGGGKL